MGLTNTPSIKDIIVDGLLSNSWTVKTLQENVFLVTKKFVTKNPDFRH